VDAIHLLKSPADEIVPAEDEKPPQRLTVGYTPSPFRGFPASDGDFQSLGRVGWQRKARQMKSCRLKMKSRLSG